MARPAAIAAVVYYGRRELQRREVARLWGRLSACVIGKPLSADEPVRRRVLGIRRPVLRHTPRNQEPDWPARCEEHQRALVSSGAVRVLAPALASAAEALTLRWDPEDQLRLGGFDALFAVGAGVRTSAADADVVRPPAPMAPVAAAVRRIDRYLRRRGLLELDRAGDDTLGPETALAASAVSGQHPPAGPQWLRGLSPLSPSALAFDKPLCASLDGFTLHVVTRAGALDAAGREALLRYVLRPAVAQERVELARGACFTYALGQVIRAPKGRTGARDLERAACRRTSA